MLYKFLHHFHRGLSLCYESCMLIIWGIMFSLNHPDSIDISPFLIWEEGQEELSPSRLINPSVRRKPKRCTLFPLQEPGVSKIKDTCFLLPSYTSARHKWLDSSLPEKSYHWRSLAITKALAINLQDRNRESTHSEIVVLAKIKISSAFIFPCGKWQCTWGPAGLKTTPL